MAGCARTWPGASVRLAAIWRRCRSGPGEIFLFMGRPDPEAGSWDGRGTYPGRAGCFPADLLRCIMMTVDNRGWKLAWKRQMVIY